MNTPTVSILCAYRPDGSRRGIFRRESSGLFRRAGSKPVRASRVEVVPTDPDGRFHVDFGPLADLTGDERFRVCLTKLFDQYEDAVAAEVAWLETNYILGADCG